jgi:hypothetical protein
MDLFSALYDECVAKRDLKFSKSTEISVFPNQI